MSAPNAKKKLKKRPLFQDIEKAKKLFEERYTAYEEVADIVIDVTGGDTGSVAEAILNQVSQQ